MGAEKLRPGYPMARTEVLVELTRGAAVESIHRGAFAVVDPEGRIVFSRGDPGLRTWTRSAVKPFQALALFESGAMDRFGIPEDELAIAIASHSGEPFHIRLVESLLRKIGLQAGELLCGPHLPFDPVARAEMLRRGEPPSVLHNNCSGKHAGMCAAAIAMGAPVTGYIESTHPLQAANRLRLASLGEMRFEGIRVGMDGCSAPSFEMPLDRLAMAFARLAAAGIGERPDDGSGLRPVWNAMVHHPDVIAGTRERIDTALMVAARAAGLPLVAKAGAEGAYAMGIDTAHGPLGIALKIEDGGERARNVVAIEILEGLGVMNEDIRASVAPFGARPLNSHAGLRVGEIRAVFDLSVDDR